MTFYFDICLLLLFGIQLVMKFLFIYCILVIACLCLGTGGFDCGSNALINLMFGPKISRPYTQSLHLFVSLGFAAGNN